MGPPETLDIRLFYSLEKVNNRRGASLDRKLYLLLKKYQNSPSACSYESLLSWMLDYNE